MTPEIKNIAVFTSGGDAPGMNAAVRAVVRASIYYKKEIFGIYRGYEGMIENDLVKLNARSVSNIIQRGGTILKSARSKEFRTEEGRAQAYQHLKARHIDALVAIGGDGTFTGLHKFYEEYKMPVICIPGTIDNDLAGTDYTIGYDTATNTAVDAIDKIRDTALSHNRLFFIEVMGRDSGQIAINSGIAGGAVAIIIPEEETTIDQLIEKLDETARNNKKSSLVVVAEGGKSGNALEIAQQVKERYSYYDTKVTILGHLQRGGAPTYFDRVLASRMGVAAIEGLLQGETDVMVGIQNGKIVYNDFELTMSKEKEIEAEALRIAKILAI
ncbi:6-phosphofructokinase [Fulvivirga sedimenti]|uniref:ATP-dependent 6-phosphofructokinase n=1 Tax=Fulvivirga sedimenti TaxID=2879465 RepID=A0A9X1HLA2_9BACT|nr:6-phosphofructokinase [Fulvivirga sedimenti]MCA6073376.1 6-phosphofructokinase [Fulvivirga sedimenti]